MNRKAQIVGQVFIFILAAGLAVLILAYGYKAISSFTSRTGEIALVNFKTDLQSSVRTIASDYGSVKRLDLNLPGGYEMLCLIDPGYTGLKANTCLCSEVVCGGNYGDYQPEICYSWINPSYPKPDNAFLAPIYAMKLSTIHIIDLEGNDKGYICIKPKGNKISLRLEGRGNYTNIYEWPFE